MLKQIDKSTRDYLARIGRKGGQKSRRQLSSEEARKMVRLREARRCFKKFYTQCFWSYDPNYNIEMNDIEWVAEQLKKNGDRKLWILAEKLMAQDSSWRFMPTQKSDDLGYVLHPIDLAINKLLALSGRDEARDFLDVIHIHKSLLHLGPLIWAACGKDPGLTPNSLLELIKRKGKYRPEDFKRLNLTKEINLVELKSDWLSALASAEKFISEADPSTLGCLFYSKKESKFVEPRFENRKLITSSDLIIHRGAPGGVLPLIKD